MTVRERELAVLRVAWLCRAPYEWGEHVELAKLCGVSAEEIERVTQGSSAAGWSDHECALLLAVVIARVPFLQLDGRRPIAGGRGNASNTEHNQRESAVFQGTS